MPTYSHARFAIAGLDRSLKNNAIDTEIITDANTGLYMLKAIDNGYISFDAMARQRHAISVLSDNIRLQAIRGMSIHEVEIPQRKLPNWITTNTEVLNVDSEALTRTLATGVKQFIPYIDADALQPNGLNEMAVSEEITVTLGLSISYVNASSQTIVTPRTITGSIKNVNGQPIYVDDTVPTQFLATAKVTINSLKLVAVAPRKILMYGLYVATK